MKFSAKDYEKKVILNILNKEGTKYYWLKRWKNKEQTAFGRII